MAKKKTSEENVEAPNTLPVKADPEVGTVTVFEEASLTLQKKRHDTIGGLFDKAAKVIEDYLGDPNVETASKMFPAKLAMDVYMTSEKFDREDKRIEIEKAKLRLEEMKLRASNPGLPPGSTFNQQNNTFNIIEGGQEKKPVVDLTELKKKQEQLLSSFRENKPPVDS